MESPLPFEETIALAIHIFISLAMLCIGMSTTLREMGQFILERDKLLRVVAANVLIPPIIALLLIAVFPLPRAVGTVLFLLALAPGGINAVQFSMKAPGQTVAAGALLIFLSIIGLVLVPAGAKLLLPLDALERVAWDHLYVRIVGVIGVPLAIGLLLRRYLSEVADHVYKPAMLISTVAFIASVVMSLSVRQEAVPQLGVPAVAAMLLFILAHMAVGWVLAGPDPDFAQVLAVCTNLRNVGLVYLMVDACCASPLYSESVLAFMALVVPANLVLTIVCAVARKRRNRAANDVSGADT
jgi:BASS family bile acid:Na+ symporter